MRQSLLLSFVGTVVAIPFPNGTLNSNSTAADDAGTKTTIKTAGRRIEFPNFDTDRVVDFLKDEKRCGPRRCGPERTQVISYKETGLAEPTDIFFAFRRGGWDGLEQRDALLEGLRLVLKSTQRVGGGSPADSAIRTNATARNETVFAGNTASESPWLPIKIDITLSDKGDEPGPHLAIGFANTGQGGDGRNVVRADTCEAQLLLLREAARGMEDANRAFFGAVNTACKPVTDPPLDMSYGDEQTQPKTPGGEQQAAEGDVDEASATSEEAESDIEADEDYVQAPSQQGRTSRPLLEQTAESADAADSSDGLGSRDSRVDEEVAAAVEGPEGDEEQWDQL